MYCNKKCFYCLIPLDKDQCSHFSALRNFGSDEAHNAAVRHVLVCGACHVPATGRCLGFIDEQSRCEKTCKEDEIFCCEVHRDNLNLVDKILTDDITEDTDHRGASDRYRGPMREAVWQKSGGICHYCETPLSRNNWQADHKQPVALGGRTTIANGVAACPPCNLRKGAMPYYDFCRQEGIYPR